jgi:hypothetical protein
VAWNLIDARPVPFRRPHRTTRRAALRFYPQTGDEMIRIRARILAAPLALAGALAFAGAARAQVFTPTFMGPGSSSDLGVYVSDVNGGTAVEGIWRQRSSSYDVGLRGGFVDVGDDNALTLGAELRNPIALQGAPIGLAFTAGAQLVIGGGSAVGVQAGLTGGHTFAVPSVTLTPYLHPRIALARALENGSDLEVDVLADLGLDLGFQPNLSVRLNVGLADAGPNWGIGVALRR